LPLINLKMPKMTKAKKSNNVEAALAAERAEALNELRKSCPAVGKRLGLEGAQEQNQLSEPSNKSNSIRTSIENPTISQVERVPQQVF